MNKVRFGRTEASVSSVSLGTWSYGGPNLSGEASVGWSGHDDQSARNALIEAHRAGINHWDTADVYGDGHAETLVGSIWEEVPRDDVFLASKVGYEKGEYPRFYHPRQIRSQIEKSLRNLNTDVIDLHYLHHCDFGDNDQYLDSALEEMHKAKTEGKIRFIGLSDWQSENIVRVIARVDPDAIQPYRNVADDHYAASGLQSWVEENDCGVAFFSPLKHGLLLGKYAEPVHFPEGDFRKNIPDFTDQVALTRVLEAANALRRRFGDHPEPVLHALVGALLAGVNSACVLLGMRNSGQVQAASRVGAPLSASDARWVESLYQF